MFCPQCGVEVDNSANFCSNCGQKLKELSQTTKEREVLLNEIEKGKRIACKGEMCTGIIHADGKCGYCGKDLDWEGNDNYELDEEDNQIKCPRCSSTQLTAQKKGFGLGKAAAGGIVLGGVGLLGGVIGAGKIKITCLKCGHSWKAGNAL